jgi:hypothetical protein
MVRAHVVEAIAISGARIEAGETVEVDDETFARLRKLGAVEPAGDSPVTAAIPDRKPVLTEVLERLLDRLDEGRPHR